MHLHCFMQNGFMQLENKSSEVKVAMLMLNAVWKHHHLLPETIILIL